MNQKVIFFLLNYGYSSPHQADIGVFGSAVITLGSQTDLIGQRYISFYIQQLAKTVPRLGLNNAGDGRG